MPDGPFSFSGNISGIMMTQQKKEEKKPASPTCCELYIRLVVTIIVLIALWGLKDLLF